MSESQVPDGRLSSGMTLVEQAIEALGGEAALAQIATVELHGSERVWEHEYSFSAMPHAEEREGSVGKFSVKYDFAAGAARIDWDRDIVRLKFRPYPTLYKYSEILVGQAGYVDGIDSSTPTKLTRMSDPPGSPMSSIRLMTTWRELTRESPRLLLDMKAAPERVSGLPPVRVEGADYPAVRFDVPVIGTQVEIPDWRFIVLFDPSSGLPARVRTVDGDPVQGPTDFDLALSDWREVDGLRFPFSRAHLHNGRRLIETVIDEIVLNPAFGEDVFALPVLAHAATVRGNAAEAVTGVPYQWTLRRVKWGGDVNTDAVAWDATARPEPEWVPIRPGIDWSDGITHNSVLIEMRDHLIVWEAALHENFGEWMIRAAKRRYPGKPIRYLVLSHHHLDHNGGARPFAAEGAEIIVPDGPGYADYFARLFEPHSPQLNDRLHRHPRRAGFVTIDDTLTLDDGSRQVRFLNIKDSDHAPALLIAYVPDADLVINTDLWNTNEKLGEKPNSRQQTFLEALERWGVQPVHSVSAHGPMLPFARLAGLRG